MDITFTGKRALVTGGGRGFGRAIAERPVEFRVTVFVIDRFAENLESLKSQIAAIGMIANGKRGAVVNVRSSSGKRTFAECSVYGCRKAALDMLTRTLPCKLERHNIRVNYIGPPLVVTRITKNSFSIPNAVAAIERNTPLRRLTGDRRCCKHKATRLQISRDPFFPLMAVCCRLLKCNNAQN